MSLRAASWPSSLKVVIGFVVGLGLLPVAASQYQWRDDRGQMVYSDQPPPSAVKPSQILRAQPMPRVAPPAAPAGAAAPADGAPSLADRRLEERRRAEENAKKQKDEAEREARTAAACDQLRAEQRTLDSGMRIATILPNGEREFLSDESRERRSAELRKSLKDMCT